MIAGFAHSKRASTVLGIDASATVDKTWDQIKRIASATAAAIELGREVDDAGILLLDRWRAGVYALPDQKTVDAIRVSARLEGIIVDPVCEGTPMAGLIDLVCEGAFKTGAKVLCAHLGGQPAING